MNQAPVDRKKVREFFKFHLDRSPIKKRRPKHQAIIISALALGVIGWFNEQALGVVALLVVLAGGYALDRSLANSDLRRRQRERKEQEDKFVALARETRRVQGLDLVKAFLRVFERTQLSRNELRTLEHRYSFDNERELFAEEPLDVKLGDLMNKSVRLISSGGFKDKRRQAVKIDDERIFLFNPMRLAALFLTETQLVICDVEVDSIEGDLKEDIQRISLNKIVNIRTVSQRKSVKLERNVAIAFAENLDFEESFITAIKEDDAGADPEARRWGFQESETVLHISRTDGIELGVPIRTRFIFGRQVSALDQDASLTGDEVAVDKMVNELNRMVESAR